MHCAFIHELFALNIFLIMSQMGEGLKYNKGPLGFKIWPLCLFAKMLLRNNFKIYIRHTRSGTGMKKTEREVYKILK